MNLQPKSKAEAGQKRPGGFAFPDPGPPLGNSTKESAKTKTLRQTGQLPTYPQRVCTADSSEPAPVASALDLRTERDPDANNLHVNTSTPCVAVNRQGKTLLSRVRSYGRF
jgi:hypothetical protein